LFLFFIVAVSVLQLQISFKEELVSVFKRVSASFISVLVMSHVFCWKYLSSPYSLGKDKQGEEYKTKSPNLHYLPYLPTYLPTYLLAGLDYLGIIVQRPEERVVQAMFVNQSGGEYGQ
jgi:hypothetical protein